MHVYNFHFVIVLRFIEILQRYCRGFLHTLHYAFLHVIMYKYGVIHIHYSVRRESFICQVFLENPTVCWVLCWVLGMEQ